MIYITRRERFNAAHKLYREDWSQEQNKDTFGKCANPNWHGHNYELYVTVKGEVNPETGFVIDLKLLKQIILSEVIDQLDLAIAIWDQLKAPLAEHGAILHSIKLYETENNYVEYYG